MTFRVGQNVVCIDDSAGLVSGEMTLVKGRVYKVYAVYPDAKPLPEIVVDDGSWRGWLSRRFRPVVERKTDISFAHEILRKASKPARSPAISSPE